jgi:GDP-L-fucose synthase
VLAPDRSELDLLDAGAVREYLRAHRFDAVIHAATDRSTRKLGASTELVERNCRMFFHLARNAELFGRMLFLSSGAVYAKPCAPPLVSEEDFDRQVPEDPYGFSKYVSAKAIRESGNIYELRLFGVFGPHEDWEVRFPSNACCRALWDIPVAMRQNVRFDYLDVDDLGRILEEFLSREWRYRHYNVCRGEAVELLDLARAVVRASGKNVPVEVKAPGFGREYSGSNRRLLEELPGFAFRPMDDSLARLYRWYEGRKLAIDPALLRFDG